MSEIEIETTSSDNGAEQAPLRSLSRREPLVVPPETRLREVLYRFSQDEEDAAVIADAASGLPLGLVTLRDILHVVSFENAELDDPVANHMIGAPLALAADAPTHRAKVMMAKRGARHLILTEPDGRLFGLVTQADLLGLKAGGAESLIAGIGGARDLHAMTLAVDRVRRRGAELFRAGMGVESLCQWMSGLNDLIAMRIIELIEDEFDLPAVPWCWIVFGSEGGWSRPSSPIRTMDCCSSRPTPRAHPHCASVSCPSRRPSTRPCTIAASSAAGAGSWPAIPTAV
jgi:CBS domain-containing protein